MVDWFEFGEWGTNWNVYDVLSMMMSMMGCIVLVSGMAYDIACCVYGDRLTLCSQCWKQISTHFVLMKFTNTVKW